MMSFLFLDSMENISASEKYLRGLRLRFPHILDMIVEMLCDISFVKFIESSSAIIEERNVAKKAMKRQKRHGGNIKITIFIYYIQNFYDI